jgi:hypothetical protein
MFFLLSCKLPLPLKYCSAVVPQGGGGITSCNIAWAVISLVCCFLSLSYWGKITPILCIPPEQVVSRKGERGSDSHPPGCNQKGRFQLASQDVLSFCTQQPFPSLASEHWDSSGNSFCSVKC